MSDFKTSYDRPSGDGIASLSASGDAANTTAPCALGDIIPIYPVRIAWADLEGEINANFTYPASLAPFSSPRSVADTQGFALRQLRSGYVMVFDAGPRVWSIFHYTRNNDGAGGSFTQQTWKPGDDEWRAVSGATPFVHVPDSATEIHICFIEHLWSRATFIRAHNNTDGFRDKVMRRVKVTSPSDATFSAPLTELTKRVEEFSPAGLVHRHDDWRALSETPSAPRNAQTIINLAQTPAKRVAPLMVALHDPAGVALELAMSHSNRMSIRAEYLATNAYALATARATRVLQNHAEQQLRANKELNFFERRALEKWGPAIRPERDTFLRDAESTLANFEAAIKGPLDAWQKYVELGIANPANTPGSIQTHLLNFDREPKEARDVAGLGRFAHDCVASIVSSQAGQERLAKVLMTPERWTEQLNPLKAFMQVTGAGLTNLKEIAQYRADITNAADDLLRDISLPMAMEITRLGRQERLVEVNRFTNGIYNRTVSRVSVDIDDAMREINKRPRETQTTFRVNRTQTVNRIRTPLSLYKLDGTVHVAGPEGIAAVGAVGAGFGILANSLNMMELIAATERSKAAGFYGAIGGNPYLGLTLTTIDTLNQLFELNTKLNALAGNGPARGYRISGMISRAQLTALMRGKTVTQDLLETMLKRSGTSASRIAAAPQRSIMAATGLKVLSGAGIALGILDLFNAAESFRRGDTIAMMSNIALGVGAILMAAGGFLGLSSSYTVVGAVAGLILVILGAVLSFFVDDPVTQWLKNGYWGTSPNYLYWADISRDPLIAGSGSAHIGQRTAIAEERKGFDFAKYFAREMQHFNEFVYWPQNAPDPPSISSDDRNWLGVRVRTPSPLRAYSVSFRLPNFIAGYSEFTGKVLAFIAADRPYLRDSGVGSIDVSDQFWESATYGRGDIVTGRFMIRVPENANTRVTDDINWELLRVEIDEGWLYTPQPGLILPRKYKDDFFGGDWEDLGAGKGGKFVISGNK